MWETIRLFFTDFKSTPLKDRIFALMAFFMFLIIAVAVAIILYQNSNLQSAKEEKTLLEIENKALRDNALQKNDDYYKQIQTAVDNCNARWQVKFDAERALNTKVSEAHIKDMAAEIAYLRSRARMIETKVKQTNDKITTK